MKKITAMLLTLCLIVGLLAACGGSGTAQSTSGTPAQTTAAADNTAKETQAAPAAAQTEAAAPAPAQTQAPAAETQAPAPETQAPEEGPAAAEGPYNVDWDEIVDIKVLIMDGITGTTEEMHDRVMEAVNELTEAEIKVHVDVEYIQMGNYAQQVSLMMSSREQLDLMLTMPMDAASMTTLANNNQLMDITEVFDEYGYTMKEDLGSLVNGCILDGKLYAVPVNRSYATGLTIYFNKDIMDDLGLTEQAAAVSSWADMEAIFEAVRASGKYDDVNMMIPGPGSCFISKAGSLNATESFDSVVTYDTLGDASKLIGVVGESDQVENIFASQGYRDMIHLMESYDEKGYVYKDSIANASGAADLMKQGLAVACYVDTEYGSELTASRTYGNVIKVTVVNYPIGTGSVNKFTWAIPAFANEPEAAMTFLSMWYNDARLANTLCWGVEGTDYVVENGIAKYPEGVENGEVYHESDFLMPNQYNVMPWDGQPADFRDASRAENDVTPVSKYIGFSLNTEPVANQIAAVQVVINEYVPTFDCGFGDDALYEEFLGKLEANGAQDIIDEYQRQLDAWLAQQ